MPWKHQRRVGRGGLPRARVLDATERPDQERSDLFQGHGKGPQPFRVAESTRAIMQSFAHGQSKENPSCITSVATSAAAIRTAARSSARAIAIGFQGLPRLL